MRTETIGRAVYRIYDSAAEQIEAATDNRERFPQWRERSFADADFIGRRFADWSDVVQATREPWAEGIKTIERMLAELGDVDFPAPISRRRRTAFREDTGAELDLDRFRAGSPYWRETRRADTRGPALLTLLVDMTTPAKRTPAEVLWRGAAAIAAVDLLERAGNRVELWAVSYSEYYAGRAPFSLQAWNLKRHSEALDAATIAGAVSPWYYRTIGLQARTFGPEIEYFDNGGYVRNPLEADLSPIADRFTMIRDCWDQAAAVAAVREALANAAKPAE